MNLCNALFLGFGSVKLDLKSKTKKGVVRLLFQFAILLFELTQKVPCNIEVFLQTAHFLMMGTFRDKL